jgi:serine/threonine protein kinase
MHFRLSPQESNAVQGFTIQRSFKKRILCLSFHMKRPPLPPGTSLGGFTILKLLGQGGFGDIYEVLHRDSPVHLALKIEPMSSSKQSLLREHATMRGLSAPFFPALVGFGTAQHYRILAMELCGASLATLRRLLPHRRFSLSTTLRMALEMLRAIESCHQLGVIHRDVKPSNFLMRATRRFPVALIDFGLSCRIGARVDDRGFTGTLKYASTDAHRGRKVGRRDDLISWFYSVVELWAGGLPWSRVSDANRILAMKFDIDMMDVIKDMPRGMRSVWRLLSKLSNTQDPGYRLMMAFIEQAITESGVSWTDKYEWEEMDVSEVSAIALVADDEREPLKDLPPPVMPDWAGLMHADSLNKISRV